MVYCPNKKLLFIEFNELFISNLQSLGRVFLNSFELFSFEIEIFWLFFNSSEALIWELDSSGGELTETEELVWIPAIVSRRTLFNNNLLGTVGLSVDIYFIISSFFSLVFVYKSIFITKSSYTITWNHCMISW